MKWLSIDFGQQRTGIAVSDPAGRMAFPRTTLVKRSRDQFFADLVALIEAEGAEGVVVGLPLDLAGQETLSTRQARNMAASLRRRLGIPIYFMEELLSSHEAEADLRESGRRGAAMRAVLDQQAAVRILESFLTLPEGKRNLV